MTMFKTVVAALACSGLVVSAIPAHAKVLRMMCKNPRQEYVFIYDTKKDVAHADEALYLPLRVVDNGREYAVLGIVPQTKDMMFSAMFKPYMKLEFYVKGELFQTDACRPAR